MKQASLNGEQVTVELVRQAVEEKLAASAVSGTRFWCAIGRYPELAALDTWIPVMSHKSVPDTEIWLRRGMNTVLSITDFAWPEANTAMTFDPTRARFKWKDGTPDLYTKSGDAQAIGTFLESLKATNGGSFTAQMVVDAARSADNPVHPLLEWDDNHAAEAWRISQAQGVIHKIAVEIGGEELSVTTSAFSAAKTGNKLNEWGWGDAIAIPEPSVPRAERLTNAIDDFLILVARYHKYRELKPIFAAIEATARLYKAKEAEEVIGAVRTIAPEPEIQEVAQASLG